MTTLTPQQAFDICQADKTAWLNLKTEREKAEQALNDHLSGDSENCPVRVAALRGRIEVNKWQINRAAGRYIRSHETLQHVSIQNGLEGFMQQHGATLAAVLAPELKALNGQPDFIKRRALDRAATYIRDALAAWLNTGQEINYCAQNNDILTAAGHRPDAASRADNQEKYTPAQHQIYARRCADMAAQHPA
ncbi:phage polarity suppression protein [Cronobacter dublinensis]|uniref:phage polarity suppression protein n=1 Tax=Cronobacter dublinensis TaxID=413497 RepID=UPI000CFBC4D5|nr:phage polarity suppression protein [Cronobacter dublinensis]EKM5761200.1 phage polarity suppression protein [Cronobacter turicensis]